MLLNLYGLNGKTVYNAWIRGSKKFTLLSLQQGYWNFWQLSHKLGAAQSVLGRLFFFLHLPTSTSNEDETNFQKLGARLGAGLNLSPPGSSSPSYPHPITLIFSVSLSLSLFSLSLSHTRIYKTYVCHLMYVPFSLSLSNYLSLSAFLTNFLSLSIKF